MPQADRHRLRTIPIEFYFYDTLDTLPYQDRLSIVLISNGIATMRMNGQILLLKSPCIMCFSKYDKMELLSSKDLSAKTFCFDPWFIKACLTFENLDSEVTIDKPYEHIRDMLTLFVDHYDNFQGVFELSPNNYLRINEILSLIGAETYAQSDRFWTCRIRRLLLQVMNVIFDLYVDQRKLKFYEKAEKNVVSTCVEYIHANFGQDISLADLCELVNLNRTSLNNRFKSQLQTTAMDYLMNYRIDTACELLSNTRLKIAEISTACGFKYDTYFIKQFSAKIGQSPTEYRKFIWAQK